MPRHNLIKRFDFIYYVMARSISEVPLLKDDDNRQYFEKEDINDFI